MADIKRNLENKLNRFLSFFPVVLITGVRQCGKTTLARKIRPDWKYYDLEKGSDYDRISNDFDFFFKENPKHLIIDEVQLSPQLFNEIRGVIDKDRSQKNRFIMTGSSSFEILKNVSESLAGRVGIIELGTLKMNEIIEHPIPDFYKIFEHDFDNDKIKFLKKLKTQNSYNNLMNVFLKGGYPEPIILGDGSFHQEWMENYFKTYIQRDIRSLFPKLNINKYRRLIQMLVSLTGTIINRSELGRSLDTSEVTVKEYLDIANGSFVWRNIPSFEKSVSKSIVKMPKGLFRDSGLNFFLQGITTIDKLSNYPFVGACFESFVIEEIIKGLTTSNVTGWQYNYYRTRNGSEIDLILSGSFGVIPIEIKYGIKTERKKLNSLSKFIKDNDLPFGIVINNSDQIEMITEKIIQIPAVYL